MAILLHGGSRQENFTGNYFDAGDGNASNPCQIDAPVGWYRFIKSARAAAGVGEQLLQRRVGTARSACRDSLEVQRGRIGQRLCRAQQDQRIHTVRGTDAQRERVRQNKLLASVTPALGNWFSE